MLFILCQITGVFATFPVNKYLFKRRKEKKPFHPCSVQSDHVSLQLLASDKKSALFINGTYKRLGTSSRMCFQLV